MYHITYHVKENTTISSGESHLYSIFPTDVLNIESLSLDADEGFIAIVSSRALCEKNSLANLLHILFLNTVVLARKGEEVFLPLPT